MTLEKRLWLVKGLRTIQMEPSLRQLMKMHMLKRVLLNWASLATKTSPEVDSVPCALCQNPFSTNIHKEKLVHHISLRPVVTVLMLCPLWSQEEGPINLIWPWLSQNCTQVRMMLLFLAGQDLTFSSMKMFPKEQSWILTSHKQEPHAVKNCQCSLWKEHRHCWWTGTGSYCSCVWSYLLLRSTASPSTAMPLWTGKWFVLANSHVPVFSRCHWQEVSWLGLLWCHHRGWNHRTRLSWKCIERAPLQPIHASI